MTEEFVEYVYDENDEIIGKMVKYSEFTEEEAIDYRLQLLDGSALPTMEKDEEFIEVADVTEAAPINPAVYPLIFWIMAFIRLWKTIHKDS